MIPGSTADPDLYDSDAITEEEHEIPSQMMIPSSGPFIHLCCIDPGRLGNSVFRPECGLDTSNVPSMTRRDSNRCAPVTMESLRNGFARWGEHEITICSTCNDAWSTKIEQNCVKNDSAADEAAREIDLISKSLGRLRGLLEGGSG